MQAKSIKGKSVEEIRTVLQQSMADGFKPTLAIVFLSIKQDKSAISKILDETGVAVYGATTNGEFTGEGVSSGEIAMMLLDINRACFNIYFEEFSENNYKVTQSQLIQSEKMASLGELTAGIAHEIQNPLNFVNNFSEVSTELIEEMKEELAVGNQQSAIEIANDLKQNLEKINHHGKRADGIVKSMLQHSRKSTNQKELTDINALCDEYLRLAYHGLRAKDKSFNAKFEMHPHPNLPKLNVLPQDVGRVVLNLINNAFYAVSEKLKVESQKSGSGYEPTVTVRTKDLGDKIEIMVKDNGTGIPAKVKEKIFQPFFTTKPTGQGTGLGLSLSYDIITKGHGGELRVETEEGEGTTFAIHLPINEK